MKTNLYSAFLVVGLLLGESLLPRLLAGNGPAAAAATVTGFTLINADTDQDLFDLAPDAVIDLATLATRNLNIRANTDVPVVGSVVFALSGPAARTQTESVAPYALFSDFTGDYFPWTPPVGRFTLRATPFDGPNGTGGIGAPLTLSFTFTNSVAAVVGYTLINADTEQDLLALTPGLVVDAAALPTRNLNIRADVLPLVLGSVTLDLTGPQTQFIIENTAPYALFSDLLGNYTAWRPINGSYTLTATPFTAAGGGGTAGSPLTITFTVVNAPLPVTLTDFTAAAGAPGEVQLRWHTAGEKNNQGFEVQRSADGRAFATVGRVAGHGSTSARQAYRYDDQALPAGPASFYYRLRQVDTDGAASFSPVRFVAVAHERPAALQVFSPLTPGDLLRYAYSGPTTGADSFVLYSLTGQRLAQYPLAPTGAGTLPTAGLPSGVYVLHLLSQTGRFAHRVVVP